MKATKLLKAAIGSGKDRVDIYICLLANLRAAGYENLAKFVSYRLQRHGVHISPKALFHSSLDLKHPTGIVIGDGVIIEERVQIYQNVTLGGARIGDYQANNYPEIGSGTTIFAGAVIVGKVRVGRDCIVGANAVVTHDIPDYSTAVGIPARVIRSAATTTPFRKDKQ